jgi:hypothetical protein
LEAEETHAVVEVTKVLPEFGVARGEELCAPIPERSAADVVGAVAGVADEFEELGADGSRGGIFNEGFRVVLGLFDFARLEGCESGGIGFGGIFGCAGCLSRDRSGGSKGDE